MKEHDERKEGKRIRKRGSGYMRKGNTWQGQEREDKRKLEDTWLGEGSNEDKEGSEEKMS